MICWKCQRSDEAKKGPRKKSDFREDAESKLFDIAACKCEFMTRCNCKKDREIPLEEKTFLHEERTVREMIIGSVDTKTTIEF